MSLANLLVPNDFQLYINSINPGSGIIGTWAPTCVLEANTGSTIENTVAGKFIKIGNVVIGTFALVILIANGPDTSFNFTFTLPVPNVNNFTITNQVLGTLSAQSTANSVIGTILSAYAQDAIPSNLGSAAVFMSSDAATTVILECIFVYSL